MSILVMNAGSSSLKFALLDAEAKQTLATGLIEWLTDPRHADLVITPSEGEVFRARDSATDHRAAVLHAVRRLGELPGRSGEAAKAITSVGHRVVHGGTRFQEPARLDGEVKRAITELAELAPLHNAAALEVIEATETVLPKVPHVAVFDTSFFAMLEPHAYLYPVPYSWYSDWGIRRFGFHGISHAYCAGRAAEFLGRDAAGLRLVICHLGNGCSASAVRGGRPVQTTMGFTPLEGLMMGTRSGSLDPGLLIHVQRCKNLNPEQLDHVLNGESGLLGVSGVSADYRQVEDAAQRGEERARLALRMYADRVRASVGALAVTMGGVDALVLTAGVGEHAAALRATVCQGLEFLGLRLDANSNAACSPDADIAAADSGGRVLILHTREDLMIAREVLRVMAP
jgi:acetate kinase